MKESAKENLKKSLNELCYANNHLNTAKETAVKKYEKVEISNALKTVETAIVSAHSSLTNFKD